MQLVRHLSDRRQTTGSAVSRCVATIGNFDGVHRGHQAVLARLRELADRLALPTVVMTFEPQPMEYFHPQRQVARLTRLREKFALLQACGVDELVCLPFDDRLASLPAQDFVDQLLVSGLRVHSVIVGDDFCFGHKRQGDFAFLQQAGKRQGFDVYDTATLTDGERRISSTRVRKALQQGDLNGVADLLGRPYSMCGRIAHGDKRGRTIGFPTANVFLHRRCSPIQGVYVVQMKGLGAQPVTGVANVGNRPTVDGSRTLLEVHLFDFDREIYGAYVEVEFLHKLRDERRFESFDALREQIDADVLAAKQFFVDAGSSS